MPLTQSECELALARMKPNEEAYFLAQLGHWLTILARGTYEFQAPSVRDPITLRQINEIQHRIFAQIANLTSQGQRTFDPETMASWLTAEEKPADFRAACIWAFEKTLASISNEF